MFLKPRNTHKNPRALIFKRYTSLKKAYSLGVMYETPDGLGWIFNIETNEMIAADLSKAKTILPVKPFSSVLRNEEWRFVYSLTDGWLKGHDIVTYSYNKTLYKVKNSFPTKYYKFEDKDSFTGYTEGDQPSSDNIIDLSYDEWLFPNAETGSGAWTICLKFTLGAWINKSFTIGATLDKHFANVGKYQFNQYYFTGSFDFTIMGDTEGNTIQPVKGLITPLKTFNIKYYSDYANLSPDDLVVINNGLYSVESPDCSVKWQPRPLRIYYATLNNIL